MEEPKLVPVILRRNKRTVPRVECQRCREIYQRNYPCSINECCGWNAKDKERLPCCEYFKGLTFGGVLCNYQQEKKKGT